MQGLGYTVWACEHELPTSLGTDFQIFPIKTDQGNRAFTAAGLGLLVWVCARWPGAAYGLRQTRCPLSATTAPQRTLVSALERVPPLPPAHRGWHLCCRPVSRIPGTNDPFTVWASPLPGCQTDGGPRRQARQTGVCHSAAGIQAPRCLGAPGARSSLPRMVPDAVGLRAGTWTQVISALTRCRTFWWPLPPPNDLEKSLCEHRIRGFSSPLVPRVGM